MTSLSKTIFDSFQVRKTQKQKASFISLLQDTYPNIKIQQGGFMKSRNLILGDVEHAEFLLTAHYDTCAQLPFPNLIVPKRPLLSLGYSLLILIPLIGIVLAFGALINLLTDQFWISYFTTLSLYFLLLGLMMCGPANKHNANDNTSGVIALLELYAQLSEDEKQKICLIFFDHEEFGLLGSAYFRRKYKGKLKDKLVINLDCVSDGNYIFVAASKNARSRWNIQEAFQNTNTKQVLFEKLERVFYPSDQAGFPNSVAIAALKHNKFLGYYMDRIHTKRDTVFDEDNIRYLCQSIRTLIHSR